MLYQLLTDERRYVRMIEYVVERIGEILRGRLIRRYCITVQKCLSAWLVVIGERHHRAVEVDWVGPLRVRARQRRISPAREHRREPLDGGSIEGGNRRPTGI